MKKARALSLGNFAFQKYFPDSIGMQRWHAPDCALPHVEVFEGDPVCLSCGMMASLSEDKSGATDTSPAAIDIPTPNPSNLNLRWPKCVKYLADFEPASFQRNFENPNIEPNSNDITQHNVESSCTRRSHDDVSLENNIRFPAFESTREIRLLRVLKGVDLDPVRGLFVVASIASGVESMAYKALSYTWADESGDNYKSRHIFIGKFWGQIADNCQL